MHITDLPFVFFLSYFTDNPSVNEVALGFSVAITFHVHILNIEETTVHCKSTLQQL